MENSKKENIDEEKIGLCKRQVREDGGKDWEEVEEMQWKGPINDEPENLENKKESVKTLPKMMK